MLTEEEKTELREMAVSLTLREEFRTLRRNSRKLETEVSADDLMCWLTAMARLYSQPAKPRPFVHYSHLKIYGLLLDSIRCHVNLLPH
jgi:hypothetical protein